MEVKLNSSDLFKGIILIVVTVVVMFCYNSYTNKSKDNTITKLTTKLSDNAIIIENIKADNSKVNKLLSDLKLINKEQSKFIKSIEVINKNKGSVINGVGIVSAEAGRTVTRHSNKSAITKTPNKTGDVVEDARRRKLEYKFTKIYGKDSNNNDLLVAWAMYFPNQDDPIKAWRTGTYPIEFNATIIESENINGTFDRAVEVHITNNNQKETRDKEFPISITDIKWEKVKISDKSMLWLNPRLGLGANITDKFISPKIDLSLSSYGKTSVDMDWRFFTFGVGAHKSDNTSTIVGSFEPVLWNIGKVVPIIENVFIGPAVTFDFKTNVNYGISLSVPF